MSLYELFLIALRVLLPCCCIIQSLQIGNHYLQVLENQSLSPITKKELKLWHHRVCPMRCDAMRTSSWRKSPQIMGQDLNFLIWSFRNEGRSRSARWASKMEPLGPIHLDTPPPCCWCWRCRCWWWRWSPWRRPPPHPCRLHLSSAIFFLFTLSKRDDDNDDD